MKSGYKFSHVQYHLFLLL